MTTLRYLAIGLACVLLSGCVHRRMMENRYYGAPTYPAYMESHPVYQPNMDCGCQVPVCGCQ